MGPRLAEGAGIQVAHLDVLDRYITNIVILHAVSHVCWADRQFGYPKRPYVPTTGKVD